MTVDTLIYAAGGGNGHLVRANNVSELLRVRGIESLIIADCKQSMIAPYSFAGFKRLIVDTFPLGLNGELNRLLALFKRKIFIARYNRSLEWKIALSLFDRVVLPYSTKRCEWDEVPAGVRHCGFLLKSGLDPEPVAAKSLIVLDPVGRMNRKFSAGLRCIAQAEDLGFEVRRSFDRLPAAHKVLSIGAGYNTVYECLRAGIDVRFVPIEKRFDDQHRRVRRLNRGVESFAQLKNWLKSDAPVGDVLTPDELCQQTDCFE